MKDAFLVVGMHRSGSSAMTRLLSFCGAALPEHLMPANAGNPSGYWEAQRAVDLNDRFLGSNASSWNDASLRLLRLPDGALAELPMLRERIAACLRDEFGEASPIVLKDPRITLLLPHWIAGLRDAGYTVRAVLTFRSPDSVAASLSVRDGLALAHARALWLKYNLLAERETRALPRAFVEYDDLIHDWRPVMDRLPAALGLSLDRTAASEAISGFLSPDLRHHRHSGPIAAPDPCGWLHAVYAALRDAARTGLADPWPLDRCWGEFAACDDLFGAAAAGFRAFPGTTFRSRDSS